MYLYILSQNTCSFVKNVYFFFSKYFIHIIIHKILQHFNIKMRQNIIEKESLKFNIWFTFFKVFMIFTRPDNRFGFILTQFSICFTHRNMKNRQPSKVGYFGKKCRNFPWLPNLPPKKESTKFIWIFYSTGYSIVKNSNADLAVGNWNSKKDP